jgi:hypothetical protein
MLHLCLERPKEIVVFDTPNKIYDSSQTHSRHLNRRLVAIDLAPDEDQGQIVLISAMT